MRPKNGPGGPEITVFAVRLRAHSACACPARPRPLWAHDPSTAGARAARLAYADPAPAPHGDGARGAQTRPSSGDRRSSLRGVDGSDVESRGGGDGRPMNKDEMKARTKAFGLGVIKLTGTLDWHGPVGVIARQLSRCGTSVGANCRAACRAKSPADFVAKMGIVEEEADESHYWMELLIAGEYVKQSQLEPLMQEADELVAIVVTTIRSTRENQQ